MYRSPLRLRSAFSLSRREALALTGAFGAAVLATRGATFAQTPPTTLQIGKRSLDVNGKPASVFGLTRPGAVGVELSSGQPFAVALQNRSGDATIVHWHGQTPPPELDGVTDTGYAQPIADGASQSYDFTPRPGTHWMHSHHGLQQQALLAAPLIVRTPDDLKADRQEVVLMLHDFSFKAPEEILASLGAMSMPGMGGMAGHSMPGMSGMAGMDLNDVDYDAYLANDRTLGDPQVVRTDRNGAVLLRIINAAASTAFWIDLGSTRAQIVAVDGNPVKPVSGSRFPITMAQRIDLLLTVPAGNVVPVLAQREGDRAQTGIVLAAPGATVQKLASSAQKNAEALDLSLSQRLSAVTPLSSRNADVTHRLTLTGGMMPYVWSINDRTWQNHQPLKVAKGQRVALELENRTMMAHPIHLHGHHFQVVAVNGGKLAGPMLDTVHLTPNSRMTLAFDADNPGRWLLHCHHLYHMATGMMTEVVYADAA